ncbi:PilZ domain-containing protein [Singulisphaera acidiphila]|uniref:PilZ domain-containing protein n=1 Tax=Singulisphaera acidiphila (strain ATCC BAA-1392 / DSM 18658 / VKM B-2454 / MOB10) TaxID=886293 RepID=L0DBW3_SINAD|nr:PilZ domain-containing protein [Singulisphaera acidiphila]AGA26156.1 hypothetical protein Sinac_1785 [Singulisphaera acidiphila DSM 18658]
MWKWFARSDERSPTESTSPPKAQRPADSPLEHTRTATAATISPGAQPGRQYSRASLRERRESPRYTAVKEDLWLGWWAEEEFIIVDAELVNISERGVQISSATAPVQGQVVWMRLGGTSTQSSLSALVLESRWVALRRRYVIRLEFRELCRSDFYNTAVFGD